MNAVSVFRLFARLFLGKRKTGFTVMADALPRERWILTVGAVFVVLGGLFPNAIVARRAAEAEAVEQAICVPMRPPQLSARSTDHLTVLRLPRCSVGRIRRLRGVAHSFHPNRTTEAYFWTALPSVLVSEVCSSESLTRLSRAAPNIR